MGLGMGGWRRSFIRMASRRRGLEGVWRERLRGKDEMVARAFLFDGGYECKTSQVRGL